jgi:hypothetical protein
MRDSYCPTRLPARSRCLPVPPPVSILAALASTDTIIVELIRPAARGPDHPGTSMWLVRSPAGSLAPNPAATAVLAFLAGEHAGREICGPALVTGGPDSQCRLRPLPKDHDEIITTVATQVRADLRSHSTQPGPESADMTPRPPAPGPPATSPAMPRSPGQPTSRWPGIQAG